MGIEKTGDNHVMKFYIENINDQFLPQKDSNFQKSFEILSDIIWNPYLEDGQFKQEYVNGEKQKLERIILSKIDNKTNYSISRCIEEMYQGEPYGLYKYGYLEDIQHYDSKELYQHYQEIMKQCKIDIFVSGNIEENIERIIKDNKNIKKLNEREPRYIPISNVNKKQRTELQEIKESMDVAQGKIIMGLDINDSEMSSKYIALVYNAILGGTANSKLFQEVREKESLAYSTSSSYLKPKNNIFILCGIDCEDYDKTIQIIKKQIEDMKEGRFTQEDLDNAKHYILTTIKAISSEQDTEISYYFGQELSDQSLSLEEYRSKIERIKKDDVIQLAKRITINTIYFLQN